VTTAVKGFVFNNSGYILTRPSAEDKYIKLLVGDVNELHPWFPVEISLKGFCFLITFTSFLIYLGSLLSWQWNLISIPD
jgi:quinol-cytochrome oxidoreductase complex cytochrome b subunit